MTFVLVLKYRLALESPALRVYTQCHSKLVAQVAYQELSDFAQKDKEALQCFCVTKKKGFLAGSAEGENRSKQKLYHAAHM